MLKKTNRRTNRVQIKYIKNKTHTQRFVMFVCLSLSSLRASLNFLYDFPLYLLLKLYQNSVYLSHFATLKFHFVLFRYIEHVFWNIHFDFELFPHAKLLKNKAIRRKSFAEETAH